MPVADEVKIVINADDNASSTINNFGKSLLSLKNILVGGAVAGVALLTKQAFDSVQAFQDAELANKQLEHAVVDVTHATRAQLQATSDLADELERKGVLDGDNIKTGLAQLSTFGLSNNAVRALAGSLADLSVNQFGVNASGEQVAQSANMIAKALNGQFGVLEKSGIRFNEAQIALIKYGTEAEKVAAINEGFQQNLRLTNEVARQTGEGLDAHLKVQLENIQEEFGKVISQGIEPLKKALSEFIDNVALPFAGQIQPMIDAFTNWINTLLRSEEARLLFDILKMAWEQIVIVYNEQLRPALARLWEQLQPLMPYIKLLAIAFGTTLVLAITGAILVVAKITEWFIKVLSVVIDISSFLIKKGVEGWNALKSAIDAVVDTLMRVIDAATRAKEAVGGAINSAKEWASSKISGVGNAISGVGKSVGIPGFAEGGIVPGAIGAPMLAVVHGGERVIPNGGGGAMGSITINMTGNQFLSQDAADIMASKIVDTLKLQLRI